MTAPVTDSASPPAPVGIADDDQVARPPASVIPPGWRPLDGLFPWLPETRLDSSSFDARHRVLRYLLWLQLPVVAAVVVVGGHGGFDPFGLGNPMPGMTEAAQAWHLWMVWGFVAGAAILAALVSVPTSQRGRGLVLSLGMLLCADALVHGSGGLTDLHLYYLVVLAMVGLYQDWVPLAATIAMVAVHHAVVGVLAPSLVYSGPQAQAHPVAFAFLHAAMVLAMSAAQITYWRFAARSQAALHAAVEESSRLALVARYTDNGVVITDPSGVVEWVNGAFTRITGLTAIEAIGQPRTALFHGPADHPEDLAALYTTGRGGDVEIATHTANGQPCWLNIEVRPIVEDGRTVHLVGIERVVTARRLAQDRLTAASRRATALTDALSGERTLLAGVISAIPHFVYWKNTQGRYRGANQAYLLARGVNSELTLVTHGEDEIPGPDPLTDVRDLEASVLRTGTAVHGRHLTLAPPDGPRRVLLVSVLPHLNTDGSVDGVIGVGADITHVSDLEHCLAQTNRLEAIGQLAAGVAHEINTPIQFVRDNTQYVTDVMARLLPALGRADDLVDQLEATTPSTVPEQVDPVSATSPDQPASSGAGAIAVQLRALLTDLDVTELEDEVQSALADSLEGLKRVTQIVQAMKDFSHPGEERADTDLNRAIRSTASVCRNEWKYDATLDLHLDDELDPVPCYEGEFKQVILNMIVNAAHAIRDRRADTDDLGTIQITTARDADHAIITLSDNGTGMDDQTRRRIFDPFFTTKPVGKGTGQGLSLAHACIVGRHAGTVDVASVLGEGTTFTIRLPFRAPEPTGP